MKARRPVPRRWPDMLRIRMRAWGYADSIRRPSVTPCRTFREAYLAMVCDLEGRTSHNGAAPNWSTRASFAAQLRQDIRDRGVATIMLDDLGITDPTARAALAHVIDHTNLKDADDLARFHVVLGAALEISP